MLGEPRQNKDKKLEVQNVHVSLETQISKIPEKLAGLYSFNTHYYVCSLIQPASLLHTFLISTPYMRALNPNERVFLLIFKVLLLLQRAQSR